MKTLDHVDVSGKRVFLRVDFNVPLDKKDGTVADDTRIRAILPPSQGPGRWGKGRAGHPSLGRPKGRGVPEMSLAPVARHLSGILGMEVPLAPDCVGEAVRKMVDELEPGRVLLLENLRFHEGETKNDPEFPAGWPSWPTCT